MAPPGKLLLGADYSQQELRILAHVSGDAGLKADFAAHIDIHLAAAARVLGLAPDQVRPQVRSVAKMINYGIAYGLCDFGLSDRLKIPREEAHRFIADYFTAYPGIRRYTVEMRILARDQGFVTTLLGRRRYLPELTARNRALRSAGERMAINMPIQGTAADGIKIAMVRMYAALRERGLRSRMLLQVHDELVFETDEEELPALAELAPEVMEGALPLDPPLEVALKVGTDWETMDRYLRDDAARGAACRSRPSMSRARRPKRPSSSRFATGCSMPELPEVETVARDLSAGVAARAITDAAVDGIGRSAIRCRPSTSWPSSAAPRSRRVGRRAKSVLLHLADGRVMTVALRMTGALIVAPAGMPDDRYARVVFQLADGRELRYRDVRKFGRIGLWEGGGLRARPPATRPTVGERTAPYRVGDVFARHGPEPLSPASARRGWPSG